jgi:hypothetical protein
VQRKYADAERWYGDVVAQFGDSHFAPEAMYWRAVAQYSGVPRSHGPEQSRRGTAKQISVQRVGEQGNPLAALGAAMYQVRSPQVCRRRPGFLLLATDNGLPAAHTTAPSTSGVQWHRIVLDPKVSNGVQENCADGRRDAHLPRDCEQTL